MNRHERRKQRALERKARRTGDTMGAGYTAPGVPEYVRNSPAFKAGEAAAKSGRAFPQRYYDDIEAAAKLIVQWMNAQLKSAPPDLRWVEEKQDGTFISGDLDTAASWLADSPDAFRLLAWLDERTGKRLSINQARWALRVVRAIPMPDGSYWGVETKFESKGLRHLKGWVRDFGKEEARVPPSPCGHCGKVNEAATNADGARASEGMISICVQCLGVNKFGPDLRCVKVDAEEYAQLPADLRAEIEDMQSLWRGYQAQMELGGKRKQKDRVEA